MGCADGARRGHCADHRTGAVSTKEQGNNRYILRLFLPRGPEETLIPCDESWEGGIMQLFSVASPLIRELLMSLSTSVAGVPPKLREQRLDSSGVDGESVWLAESSQPQD